MGQGGLTKNRAQRSNEMEGDDALETVSAVGRCRADRGGEAATMDYTARTVGATAETDVAARTGGATATVDEATGRLVVAGLSGSPGTC